MDKDQKAEPTDNPIRARLEQPSRYDNCDPHQMEVLYSIAISLKRIADALTTTDQYGLTGSSSISQAIKDGLQK